MHEHVADMIFTPESQLGRAQDDFNRIAEKRDPLVREMEMYRARKSEAEALIASLTAASLDEHFVVAAAAREKIKVFDAALLDVQRRLAAYEPHYRSERSYFESLRAAWASTSEALSDRRTSSKERERLLTFWQQLTGLAWEE